MAFVCGLRAGTQPVTVEDLTIPATGDTGDNSLIDICLIAMLSSAAGLIVIEVLRRKRCE